MAAKSYRYSESGFQFTEQMKQSYEEDGYILVRELFSPQEVNHVETTLIEGRYGDYASPMSDGQGKSVQMTIWNHASDDVTGMLARCNKMVDTCEQILGGDILHYHSKMMVKQAETGGKHLWHQDFSYWYKFGFLFPHMLTVFIAIDKCAKENGCLKVLRGSHKCGLISHRQVEGQLEGDPERVEQIAKVCQLDHVEMEPGDALFFHANLLHSSGDNTSSHRRLALLTAYCRTDNKCVIQHHLDCEDKMEKVDNSAILKCTKYLNAEGKGFKRPALTKK